MDDSTSSREGAPSTARHTLTGRRTTATGRSPGSRVSALRPPSRIAPMAWWP